MNPFKRFGPGLIVTAAFIGPGTITTATAAGATYGFALAWAILFSVFATIILQEMAARLGLVTRNGLGEALRETFSSPIPRIFAILLVVSAITLGSAAYEMGNITGAGLGLEMVTGVSRKIWAIVVGVSSMLILIGGGYKSIERLLMSLVGVMGVVFIVTAIMSKPDSSEIVRGLFQPKIPQNSLLTIIALIGTTVVPYNLFLHASAVTEKWPASQPLQSSLKEVRWDTFFSVMLGGLITLAVLCTAAVFYTQGREISNPADMAEQLQPLLGNTAKWFFAFGFFAAGLTSAVTAPLAAAYATCGAVGWDRNMKSTRFRLIWFAILLIGTILAAVGRKPIQAIIFAQAANGILLPVIAVFLLVAVNQKKLLRSFTNRSLSNVLGVLVVLVVGGLGLFKLWKVFS